MNTRGRSQIGKSNSSLELGILRVLLDTGIGDQATYAYTDVFDIYTFPTVSI